MHHSITPPLQYSHDFSLLYAKQMSLFQPPARLRLAMRTKDAIRQSIWALLRQHKVARFPGAQGRIPNFIGAEACARLISGLPCWKKAKTLKVNPDSPQRAIRQKALQ